MNKLIAIIYCICVLSVTFPLSRFLPNVFSICFLIGFVIYLIQLSRGKLPLLFPTPLRLILVFFVYLFINLVLTGSSIRGIEDLSKFSLVFLLTFFVVNTLKSKQQLDYISKAWIFGTVASTFLGIYDVFTGAYLSHTENKFENFNEELIRYIPYDFEPNYLQITLPFALLVSLYFFLNVKKYRWAFFVCFLIVILEYILTVSKFAFLTLLILAPFFFIENFRHSKLRKFSAGLLLLAVISVSFININLSFLDYNIERYSTLKSTNLNEVSSQRDILFRDAVNLFYDSPIIGNGLGNTTLYLTEKHGNSAGTTHNSFLHVLSETGIIGAFLFGLIIIKLIDLKMNIKLTVFQKIAIITLLPMMNITAGTSIAFWFILAICYQSKFILSNRNVT